MYSKAGSFNSGTGALNSTQEITIGFQAKVIFFWWNGRTESTDTVGGATHRRGFGVATSTSARYCFDTRSVDASGSSVSSSYIHNAAVIIAHTDTTLDGAIDVSAIGASSFTLIVDDVMPHDLRVHYLALGGSDVVNAACGTVLSNAQGDYVVSGLGWQPNFAMLFGGAAYSSAPGGNATNSTFAIGIATSSTNQASLAAGTDDASNTMDTASYNTDNEFYSIIAGSVGTTRSADIDFTSFDSGGFTANGNFSQNILAIYVALNCTNVIVGNSLTQTNTSTDIVISGLGWQPAAGMVLSHCRAETTTTTMQRTDKTSIGAFTSATERVAHGVRDEDNVADSNVATAVEHDEVYVHISDTNDTVEGLMDVKSVDSGGVTFIMDDADPAQAFFGYVLFGPAQAAGTNWTKTLTDTAEISDTISKVIGRYKTLTDTSEVSDVISKSIGRYKIITETANVSDTLSRVVNKVKSLSNTVNIADTLTKSIAKVKSIANTINVADVISGAKLIYKTITNTINISDTIAKSIGRIISLSDTIKIRDTSNHVAIYIDHERGDNSEYTNWVDGGGDLQISENAALAGTNFGMLGVINDTTTLYGEKIISANTSGVHRYRFYFDPNSVSMPESGTIHLFYTWTSAYGLLSRLTVRRISGSYYISCLISTDQGTLNTGNHVINDSPVRIEVKVTRATSSTNSDGSLYLYIENILEESITGIDNYDTYINFWSASWGVGYPTTGISGSIYLDEIVVNTDGVEIGAVPASLSAIRSLVKSISNTNNVSDTISKSIGRIKSISNTINVSDTITNLRNIAKTITDTINISDTLTRVIAKAVAIANSVNVSDTIVNVRGIYRVLADAINVVDTIASMAFEHAHPNQDITVSGWTNELNSSVDIYTSIDEITPDDNDYIKSPVNPTLADIYETKLGILSTPSLKVNHSLFYRYKKSSADNLGMIVKLMQGNTEIASWNHATLPETFTTVEQSLTQDQMNAITDYTDLRIRFIPSGIM